MIDGNVGLLCRLRLGRASLRVERAGAHRPPHPCRGGRARHPHARRKVLPRRSPWLSAPPRGHAGPGLVAGVISQEASSPRSSGFLYVGRVRGARPDPDSGRGLRRRALLGQLHGKAIRARRGRRQAHRQVLPGLQLLRPDDAARPLANNMGLMWVAIEATTLVSVFMIMLYTTRGRWRPRGST